MNGSHYRVFLISFLIPISICLCAQLPDNYEFLDHRVRSSFLGAATMIGDKVYYVSHNSVNPWTTFNVVDKDRNVETLLSLKYDFSNSKLFEVSDTSAIIVIDNLIEYDIFLPGYYLIHLSPDNVRIDSLYTEWNDNPIYAYSVSLDSLGRQILTVDGSLLTIENGEIVENLRVDAMYKIFHNSNYQLFGYNTREIFRYDDGAFGAVNMVVGENFNVIDLKSFNDKNYLMARDYSNESFLLKVYTEDFSEEIYSIELPYRVLSFDQFVFEENEIKIIFSHDNMLEIMLIDDEGNLSTFHTDESKNEIYSKFIPLDEDRILLMGAYGPDFNQYGFSDFSRNIFFRNYSLTEENIYDRVDVRIDDIQINRLKSDTTETYTRAPGDVLHFGNHSYDIDIEIQNEGTLDVSLLNIFSAAKLDGVSSKFHLDFEFDKQVEAGSSKSSNYKLSAYHESKGLRDTTDLPLFIPGADYRFNKNPFSDLQVTVDVKDLILNSAFIVYPNPTSDFLNFELEDKIRSVSIYNLSGQLIYHKNGRVEAKNIDVSNLNSGTYFLKLEIEKGYMLSKFVKV